MAMETIGPYRILEKLGEGGMGVVYKAWDDRLERHVALKWLTERPGYRKPDPAELEREAKAVSALNHPHIAAIHDRGQADGRAYLVFEYLPGGTLAERLPESGLPLADVVRYGGQCAQGLAHAHQRGVLHRDVKTDNLMLGERDELKITDFGLAIHGDRRTSEDTIKGTAAYMSPEQCQGGAIDERSDVYSLGIVLYELATGRPPFIGEHPAAVLYDVVHTPTPSVRDSRPDLPAGLDAIIGCATAKDPDDRYSSIDALAADLATVGANGTPAAAGAELARRPLRVGFRTLAVAAVLAAVAAWAGFGLLSRDAVERPASAENPISLAVMPIENLSGDEAQDYLAAGLTDALVTDLARLDELRVVSRNSVAALSERQAPDIARELGVERIIEGSVLAAGERIRVRVRLIDAMNDVNLWASNFDFEAQDVLTVQQDLAEAVSRQMKTRESIARRLVREVDPEAYAAFVRGRMAAFDWTPGGARRAVAEFERAISIEPEYADAFAGLAYAYGFMSLNAVAPPDELWPKARAAAERALELDPTLDQAYAALGFVESAYDWNWGGAERHYRKALELNPGSVDARHALGMTVLGPLGRLDEAVVVMQQAARLDPQSAPVSANLASLLAYSGNYSESVREYGRALEIEPNFSEALIGLGFAHLMEGNRAEATEAWRRAASTSDTGSVGELFLAITNGRQSQALEMLDAAQSSEGPKLWCAIAIAYAELGEKERALAALERGYEIRESELLSIGLHPILTRELGDEPRYRRLLERMNLR